MPNSTSDMTPQQFINIYYSEAIEAVVEEYSNIYMKADYTQKGDATWDQIREFLSRISEKDKNTILLLMRQAMIDTSSQLFGIIDGSCYFREGYDKFKLIQNDNNVLSGELQDLFLARDQDGVLE